MKTRLNALVIPVIAGLLSTMLILYPSALAGFSPVPEDFVFPPAYHQVSRPGSKIQVLLHEVRDVKEQNPAKALHYAQIADSLALAHGLRFYAAQSAYWLAWLNHYEAVAISYQSSLIDAQICLNRLRPNDPPYWQASAHILLAAIYVDQDNFTFTQKHLAQALPLASRVRSKTDSLELRAALHSIQALLPGQSAAQAKSHFQQAIADFTAADARLATARVCRNYALFLLNEGESAQAGRAFQQSVQLFRQENALDGLRKTLVHYANHWTEQFNQTKDTLYFRRALNLLQQALVLNPDLETYFQTGYTYHCYLNLFSNKTYHQVYFDSTHYYYGQALQKITSSSDFENIKLLAENIDKLSWVGAYRYGALSDLAPAYESLLQAERKATERAKWRLQANERARHKSELLNYLLIGVGTLVGLGFYFRHRLRNRKKAHQETYVQLLQTRLNPHFISNALNSIDALVRLKKERTASEYLVKFNRFCRNVLEASDQPFVSLQKELETLTWYLDLEKLRLGDRLRYNFHIDENVNPRSTQIPLFLLQPFLENAIWHGIHPKAEGGTLCLNVQKMPDQRIRIEIEDDGVGRSAIPLEGSQNQDRRSWGKDISDQRLQLFNGTRGIPVDLQNGTNGIGTRVIIFLTERLTKLEQ